VATVWRAQLQCYKPIVEDVQLDQRSWQSLVTQKYDTAKSISSPEKPVKIINSHLSWMNFLSRWCRASSSFLLFADCFDLSVRLISFRACISSRYTFCCMFHLKKRSSKQQNKFPLKKSSSRLVAVWPCSARCPPGLQQKSFAWNWLFTSMWHELQSVIMTSANNYDILPDHVTVVYWTTPLSALLQFLRFE